MSRDRTVGDTFYILFTTRAFATGIPTVLSGSPVVSAYEDNSATQITAGITLGVDHDSVVGLNLLTIVATGANSFESGKDYHLVITVGTVGGVSVVGEVVGHFSLELSAAAIDLANATDGLGAIKSDTAATLTDTADMQPKVAKIPLSDGTITWNSTALASINGEVDTALTDYDGPTNAEMIARTLVSANYATAANLALVPNAAEINAEMVDVMSVDIHAESSGVPAAATTYEDAIMFENLIHRNKITQTETTLIYRNDADTLTIATAIISDDTTTFIRGELS